MRWFARCLRRNMPGPYQIQAAIAAVHDDAATTEATQWSQIVQLYDQLMAIAPSPIVDAQSGDRRRRTERAGTGSGDCRSTRPRRVPPVPRRPCRAPRASRPRRRGRCGIRPLHRARYQRGRARPPSPPPRRPHLALTRSGAIPVLRVPPSNPLRLVGVVVSTGGTGFAPDRRGWGVVGWWRSVSRWCGLGSGAGRGSNQRRRARGSTIHAAATGWSIGQMCLVTGASGLPNNVRTAATSTLTGFTDAIHCSASGIDCDRHERVGDEREREDDDEADAHHRIGRTDQHHQATARSRSSPMANTSNSASACNTSRTGACVRQPTARPAPSRMTIVRIDPSISAR